MAEQAPPVVAQAAPLWGEVTMKRHESDRTAWLITCVDLTSLLVGFFVLLFSMQTLRQDKWQEVTGSFKQQFANMDNVVPVIPDDGNNAVVRVAPMMSGLAYLDTLFHQRVEGDPEWSALGMEMHGGQNEMTYVVPQALVDAPEEVWGRLGNVLRGWKNPVGIRVTTTRAKLEKEGARAIALSAKLANTGVVNVFTDLQVNDSLPQGQVRLVVLAQ